MGLPLFKGLLQMEPTRQRKIFRIMTGANMLLIRRMTRLNKYTLWLLCLLITSLIAACNGGDAKSDSTDSETTATTNHRPIADIAFPGNFRGGDSITLDGRSSSDPDGDLLTYTWMQLEGENISLLNAADSSISFIAPSVQQPTRFSFGLTVNDGEFDDSTQVTFQIDPNPIPSPDPGPESPDTVAPVAISKSPRNGQVDVAVTSSINVTFNEDLLQSSINNVSMTLSTNGMVVPGDVSYDNIHRRVLFNPTLELKESTTYTVTLSGSIQDLAGNNIQTENWTFTTGASLVDCDLDNEPVLGDELYVGQGQMFSTIQEAIDASQNGDTITIHAGTYFEANLRPKSGVSAAQHTVLRGAPGESKPIINAQGVFNQGPYAIIIEANHVTLKNLDVREGGGRNITVGDERPASDIIIDGLNIIDANPNSPTGSYDACCNAAGIFVGYHGAVDGLIIKNTYFHNIYAAGVKVDARANHAQNVTIENNFFDRDHSGVHVKWAEEGVDRGIGIRNNYFFNIESYSVHLEQPYSIIQNNIIYYSNRQVGVYIAENKTAANTLFNHNTLINTIITMRKAIGVQIVDNIIYQGLIRDYSSGGNNSTTNNFTSDPMFVDLAGGDFSLRNESHAIKTASDGMDYGVDISIIGICGVMPIPF